VTDYAGGNGQPTTLQASGTGSVLDLPDLTTWEGEFNGGNIAQISALSGGEVSFAALTTDEGGLTNILSQGSGSIVDLSALTNFISSLSGYNTALEATQGGRIESPDLTSFSDVNLTIDGTGTQDTAQITSFVGGTLTVSGGSPSFTDLNDFDRSSILVSGGVSITLPALSSYTGVVNVTTYLQVTGPNSVLALPVLAAITGAAGDCCSSTQVRALSGGDVELPALAQIGGPSVWVESDGSDSKLDAPALVRVQGANRYTSEIKASNGGDLMLPVLASCTAGTIAVDAASLSLPDLSDIDESSVLVSPGTQLTLPLVTSYTGVVNVTTYLQVTGPNSVLSLPALATITGAAGDCCSSTQVQALAGGHLELPALAQIGGPSVWVESDGGGSTLDVPDLVGIQSADGYTSALKVSDGGVIIDPDLTQISGVSLIGDSNGAFTISPSLGFTFSGGTSTVQTGTLIDEGNIDVQSGATLNIEAGLSVNGSGILTTSPGSTIEISGNFLGTTENADDFYPQGTVAFDSGSGTTNPPQELEAMSADLGATQAGFVDNFAYGTVSLTSDTSVELVDLSHNTTSTGPEAVYANELIVPSGATLNLNNLHLYVRGDQISGTIVSGTVTVVPSGGSIALNTPTPGNLTPAGAVDDWTFYGTTGESITVQLNPGGSGAYPAFSPQLNWGEVELLDPHNDVLASASSSSSGAFAAISAFALPASETYTLQVQAPSAESSSSGNYVLSAYNVTPNNYSLSVNQTTNGTIHSAFGVDRYSFTANANEQVDLNFISAAGGNVAFNLTGPSGTIFTNLQSDSGPVTLPSSGSYVLTVQGNGGQGGAYAFELQQTSVNTLTLGTPYSGTLAGSGQAQLFSVSLPLTQSLLVTLKDTSSADINQIYAKLGSPPTQSNYGYAFADGVSANQQLLVSSAAPGTWYILVYSVSVPAASTFTLSASGEPVTLATVAPAESATGSTATLTLTGSGFNSASSVELVSTENTIYTASGVTLDTFTQLSATFNLSGVPQGTYSVVVKNANGASTSLPGVFTVTAAAEAHFDSKLILPSEIGRHISSTFYVEYSNTGDEAMPAPLLVVTSAVADDLPLMTLNPALVVSGYWTSAIPEGYSNTIDILASGTEVPGWLEPGESFTVPVYYAGMQQPWNLSETTFGFNLDEYTQKDVTTIDWTSLQTSLQPSGVPNAAWAPIYGALTAQIGSTWGDYVTTLDNEADYLGRLGEDVTDVSDLWAFATAQADGLSPMPVLSSVTDLDVPVPGDLSLDFTRTYQEPISARDALGPLGYGWTDDWQYSLSLASDGTVTVTMPTGQHRVFQPDSRGSDYFDEAGDYGVLSEGTGGTFTLQESNGQIEAFNANGTLDYIQDTDGDRITAGYEASELTSLTASSGASLTMAYNASGLISSVTTSTGQTVEYTYDSGLHLIDVTSFDGEETTYAYVAGSDAATKNALGSITNADGTSQSFTFNAAGQLAGTAQTDGADAVTFTYSAGEVTVTDAAGDASQYFFDQDGLLVKTVDPLGNISFATYDANDNLTSLTGPTGLTTTYQYDDEGNLISSTDPLGQATTYTYTGSDNLLSSVSDPQGNTTQYRYDASGDLKSTELPNDTVQTATYDATGDPLSLTNPDGQVTQYTYNASGQVASVTLAGGSTMTYSYDAQGNLVETIDSTGTTTLTYNTADELTSVDYPGGLALEYTFNAGGQRTRMVELSGSTVVYTVNYAYNSLGQLTELTDGTGALIASYAYNSVGELTREDEGDGTYTTYTFDADANVLTLYNYAANGSVNSSFVYTYNALGEQTSEATIDGTWTYGYDNDGELVSAAFASTNPSVSSQSLIYVYNAAGDRTETIINGVTTSYVSNNVNEYTTVGGATYEYDADGNLTSMTDASGTTTYTYNSLNQLVGVSSSSGTWTYQYDALGIQVATTTNGQTTENLVDPTGLGNLVGQITTSGTEIASYTYGLGLVSQVTPSGTNYYQFDALGSTADMTNATNGVVASYGYLPFGGTLASISSVANPFEYAGQFGVSNDGSGLYDMRARSYDPETGQLVSNDPAGLVGGDVNIRRYAGNDPVNVLDPSGLGGTDAIEAIFGGASAGFTTFSTSLEVAAKSGFFENGAALGPLSEATAPFSAAFGGFEIGLDISKGDYGSALGEAIGVGLEIGLASQPELWLVPIAWEVGSMLGQAISNSLQQKNNTPHYFKLHAEVVAIRASARPTPPPPPVKCKPLPPSDTGYSAFSGSLGSTTMCKGSPMTGHIPFSYDPNSIIGPTGVSSANFVLGSALSLYPYQINFENSPTATAPAQQVVITDTLDPSLDLNTFYLTEIAFGDTVLAIPPGRQDYQTTVPMTFNGVTFDVVVNASLNYQTRELTVTFQSIDPATQLPPGVLTGFLPPEDGTGRGEGYVSFVISPNAGLATGTQIRNVANIIFDGQPAIATDLVSDEDPSEGIDTSKEALLTVDNTVPTSSVLPLPPTESSTSLTLSWSGSDGDGSGIAYFNVYVSDDGGPFDSFQMSTTATSATFTGQAGHTYSFISIATSNVGITQPAPTAGQTTTRIIATPPPSRPAPPTLLPADVRGSSLSNTTDDSSPAFYGTAQANSTIELLSGATVIGTTTADASGGYTISVQSPLSPGTYELTVVAINSGGTSAASSPLSLTIVAPPPPLVTVESVQVETIKVGKGKKAKKETVIVVEYSGVLNAGAADNASAYDLAQVIKVKASGKGKNKKPATTKLGALVPVASAVYTASNNSVTLTPRVKLTATKPEELIVNGSLLTDTLGREVDGNDDGQPGGNYIATISGSRVTAGGVSLVRTQQQPLTVEDAVDDLLARGDLAGIKRLVVRSK
jgi:RHS repeat-associated protein